jgi:hypothetical protein
MREPNPVSYLFAANLREAQDASRAIAESVRAIDALVAQTREVIADSRDVITRADALLARDERRRSAPF